MVEFVIAMLLAVSASGSESAAQEAAAEAPAPAAAEAVSAAPNDAKPEKPKRICMKVPGTGSRLTSGRLCKTAEEWKRFNAE